MQWLFYLASSPSSAPQADRRSPLFIKRIFLLIIFIIASRNVANSVICQYWPIPPALAPFLLYCLGFIVAGTTTTSTLAKTDARNSAGVVDAAGGPQHSSAVSDETPQQQQRSRRRSAMSSVSSSFNNDRSLPNFMTIPSSSSATHVELGSSGGEAAAASTRGRRTSLPALSATNVHRHRVSQTDDEDDVRVL